VFARISVDFDMPTKAKKKKTNRKKAVAKTAKPKKVVKKKAVKKRTAKKIKVAKPRPQPEFVGLEALEPKRKRRQSGRMAGDLQGVSRVESADSESVAELLEEGNVVEAEAVAGVEAADFDDREVQSHEVPEDDVPEEYREKD
jgi:hypothetical protein